MNLEVSASSSDIPKHNSSHLISCFLVTSRDANLNKLKVCDGRSVLVSSLYLFILPFFPLLFVCVAVPGGGKSTICCSYYVVPAL